jgi:hypothetical protein
VSIRYRPRACCCTSTNVTKRTPPPSHDVHSSHVDAPRLRPSHQAPKANLRPRKAEQVPKRAAKSHRRCATRLLHMRTLREGIEEKRNGPVSQDGEACVALGCWAGKARSAHLGYRRLIPTQLQRYERLMGVKRKHSLVISRAELETTAEVGEASGRKEETCCAFSRITSM